MNAYIDATVLIALGQVGELERLSVFDANLLVLPVVRAEVTTEPGRLALDRALKTGHLNRGSEPVSERLQKAATVLDDPVDTADGQLIAAVIDDLAADRRVAVVSDDRRLRTVAQGLGATVTGTIGVVVRGVAAGRDPTSAKALVRRLDQHGLHMTASLRERALDLIDEAAD